MEEYGGLYRFRWPVSKEGYCIIEDTDRRGQIRRVLAPVNDAGEVHWYSPLEEQPDLFFAFSEITTEQDALSFAKRFGRLLPDGDREELEFRWLEQAFNVKALLQVWDWLQKGEVGKLGQHIVWRSEWGDFKQPCALFHFVELDGRLVTDQLYLAGHLARLRRTHSVRAFDANIPVIGWDSERREPNNELYRKWRPGEVKGLAMALLAQEVNKRLRRSTSFTLTVKAQDLIPYVICDSLLAAIWLQLAQVFTGERQIKRCEICKQWMDVTGKRSSKKFHDHCSLKERMKRLRSKSKPQS